MFVTGEQLQAGVIRYMQQDMLPKVEGWRKVALGAALQLASQQNFCNDIIQNPAINILGLKNEQGCIDLPKLKQALCNQLGNQSLQINIPAVGCFRFRQSDLQRICRLIQSSQEVL